MKQWWIVPLVVFIAGFLAAAPAAAWDLSGTTMEWPVDPDLFPEAAPYDIIVLEDGSVWFTSNPESDEPAADLFSFLLPDEVFVLYSPEDFSAHFQTLAPAPDGTIWITDKFGSLVRFSPATQEFEQFIPSDDFPDDVSPYGVTVAPDGRVWFTGWSATPCIGVYDPSTGVWIPYALPDTADPLGYPVEIDLADDGTVWFTIRSWGPAKPALARLDDQATGAMTVWMDWTEESTTVTLTNGPLPRFPNTPWGIIANGEDPAEVWFTDKNAGLLIRFVEGETPGTGVATWYDVFDTLLDTHFIAEDPEGDIWLASLMGYSIGVFDQDTSNIETMAVPSGESPLSIAISPDGSVWWTTARRDPYGGGIGRLITILAPVADAGPDQTVLRCGAVTLDGSGSSDPDGTLVTYAWDFGDGTTGEGITVFHTYPSTGDFTATLTVTDDDGMTGTDTATITVLTPTGGITELRSMVIDLPLPIQREMVLLAYLDNAQSLINRGTCSRAATTLLAFNKFVNRIRGEDLTDEQADLLIDFSNGIIASMQECGCG